jgi:2,4-dienoyl-CoA reductase-like NADH-dependent reductase (Old Yellow Enzyme family)
MMTPTEALLQEIDAFLDRHKVSASAFGRAAVNDPNFVSDLRDGREPKFQLMARVRGFMAATVVSDKETAA